MIALDLGAGHAGDIALAYPAIAALQEAGQRVVVKVNPAHRRAFGALAVDWSANAARGARLLTIGRNGHPVRAWLDQAAAVIGTRPNYRFRPRLPVIGAARAAELMPGDRWVVLAPAATRRWKAWGDVAGWAALGDQARLAGYGVAVVGPAEVAELAAGIAAAAPGVVNLVGQDTPETWPALIERAAVVVAPDGGTMHVADLLGARVVALFGPTDPTRWGPYWCGDFIVQASTGRTGDITVDEISNALADALAAADDEREGVA
ncbi:glycosyltransferase family 9 protein [Lysobacter enzymogenes]|uniref:glycosyltransferase family 9 protein n=1 Tax=Lysobacter enzymogenes TaxID=69 RepID=UPI00384CDA99